MTRFFGLVPPSSKEKDALRKEYYDTRKTFQSFGVEREISLKLFEYYNLEDKVANTLWCSFMQLRKGFPEEGDTQPFNLSSKDYKDRKNSLGSISASLEALISRREQIAEVFWMYFDQRIKGPDRKDFGFKNVILSNFEPSFHNMAVRVVKRFFQFENEGKFEPKKDLFYRVGGVLCALYNIHYRTFEYPEEFNKLSKEVERLLDESGGFGRYLDSGDPIFEAGLTRVKNALELLESTLKRRDDVCLPAQPEIGNLKRSRESTSNQSGSSRNSFTPTGDRFDACSVTPEIVLEDLRKWSEEAGGNLKEYKIEMNDWHSRIQAKGGFGEIVPWSPPDSTLTLALKELSLDDMDKALARRFIREVRVWMNLKHPNVCELLGFGMVMREGDPSGKPLLVYPALAAEYFHEGTVLKLLNSGGEPLPKELQDDIIFGVCSAISYMHSESTDASNAKDIMVYSDLKPDNVLMKNGLPYLCDFGLSHICDGVRGFSSKSRSDERWSAPEVKDDPGKKTSPASDVFSLALFVIAVLTKKQPWKDFSTADQISSERLRIKSANLPVVAPPELEELDDPDLRKFLERCLTAEPRLRPPARFVEERLKRFRLYSGSSP